MDLSIIIVSFNTKALLISCIKSIKKYTKGISYEIIVIDNGSSDGSVEAADDLGAKVIRNKKNLGFAAANNQGFRKSSAEFVLFLNSDTEVENNVLGEMVAWMRSKKQAGVATCALKGKDNKLQPTGGYFPNLVAVFSWMTIQDIPGVDLLIRPFHPLHTKSFLGRGENFYRNPRELDWVTGAFLLTRREILQKIDGWDESYFMYVEEVDLCFRLKKQGYQVWYLPDWQIIHLGGASSRVAEFPLLSEYKGIKRFYKKFYPSWQYPILRFFLKLGALGRIVLFGILEGGNSAKIYAKAFWLA